MAKSFVPAVNSFSRVFLIEGGARPDHEPSFQSCMAVGGVSRSYGDITRIECPDPDNYGKFIEVGTIRGATERVTTTITGRYAADLRSDMLRIAEKGCEVDVHVHFGACTDPSVFNEFTKAVILESASPTSYSTGELGTLGSDGQSNVDESLDISAADIYEVLRLAFAERAGDVVNVELVDVTICDTASCGDCEDESDGCEKIFAISLTGGLGSPTTRADVVYSLDGGNIWRATDVDSAGASNSPDAIACLGSYLVVVSNADGGLHYALKSQFDGTTDPTFTAVTTGVVVGGEPNDIWSLGNFAFAVGDLGYVYKITDPTVGFTVLDAGVATIQNLNAVHAISQDFAVAVGASNAVIKTENGTTWTAVTGPAVGVALNAVWVVDENQWWIGSAAGNLYYTLNGGTTWATKAFSGSGSGSVRDIAFASKSVGYLSHSTTTPAGRILRTYNGGQSWSILPEGTGSIPANDRITALAACASDVNFIVGVGLADNGSDGIVVVGQA